MKRHGYFASISRRLLTLPRCVLAASREIATLLQKEPTVPRIMGWETRHDIHLRNLPAIHSPTRPALLRTADPALPPPVTLQPSTGPLPLALVGAKPAIWPGHTYSVIFQVAGRGSCAGVIVVEDSLSRPKCNPGDVGAGPPITPRSIPAVDHQPCPAGVRPRTLGAFFVLPKVSSFPFLCGGPSFGSFD